MSIATVMGRDQPSHRKQSLGPLHPSDPQNWDLCPGCQPGSGHDSNLCLSKAARYCAMGSFHPELVKPNEVEFVNAKGAKTVFSKVRFVGHQFHGMFPVVESFLGCPISFRSMGVLRKFLFWGRLRLSHPAFWVCKGGTGCALCQTYFPCLLSCLRDSLWDLVFCSSAFQIICAWFTWAAY